MMLYTALSMTAAALAAQVTPLPPRPPGSDPRNWPTPVMDSVPPKVPRFRRPAVLVLSKTNGFRDDDQIEASKRTLTELIRRGAREVFETENAAVVNPRDLKAFSTIVLNSTSGNIFDAKQREAFRAWVEQGGGVVLLHNAGVSQRTDWSWYAEELLGARFIGHTGRPKQFQQGTIDIVAPDHPVTRGLPARWTREEEWYSFDRVPSGSGTRILATVDEASYDPSPARIAMGAVHPIIWQRCIGRGRMVYSALGHKAETYAEPLHRTLIANAIDWASNKAC